MFEDIIEFKAIRKKYNSKMFLSGIKTFREIADAEENALKDGAMEQKYKELIALGISVSNKCYGCIEYHVSRAVELGVNRKEILEATAIALALSGTVADWPARFVFKVLEELEKTKNNNLANKSSL